MARRKKKGNPIIVGLIFLGGSIGALWKNEHRFDYYKAARATKQAQTIDQLASGSLFSFTGAMDQNLTMDGHYVQSFEGFLEVTRLAEIYAWNRDEDDDGVTWSKEWMSSLQNNSRNQGLNKRLKSGKIRPEKYQVANLTISSAEIQFVDKKEEISPSKLKLSEKGASEELDTRDQYFYLSKREGDQLGDERLSYRALPIPETATYFGKLGEGIAVAHQVEKKSGIISSIIEDKGILHHLVAGERKAALESIKAHIARLKMIVRGIGLLVASIGGGLFFSSLTRFLIFIPVVGPVINRISYWIGMLIGFALGFITMALGFLSRQPILLVFFIFVLAAGLYFLWKNAAQKRDRIQRHLTKTLGHSPSQKELEELEFIKLWQLIAKDGQITPSEQRGLNKWTNRHRWSSAKIVKLTERAQKELPTTTPRDNLESLIRFSLADGHIDGAEMKGLEHAARKNGIRSQELTTMIFQIQKI